jgi:membrane protease YdiL (CAAX protease family)
MHKKSAAFCTVVLTAWDQRAERSEGAESGEQRAEGPGLGGRAIAVWLVLNKCCFSPVFEELMFRSYLLPMLLCGGLTGQVAVGVSSLAFGALHLDSYNFPYQVALGALTGFAYLRSGSLLVPIAMHCVHNVIQCVLGLQQGTEAAIKVDRQALDDVDLDMTPWLRVGSR